MDWTTTRERLGVELIGAREQVARRWRQLLDGQGRAPRGLEAAATELLLEAGAALDDDLDLPIFNRALRFGGVKLVTWPPRRASAATRAA